MVHSPCGLIPGEPDLASEVNLLRSALQDLLVAVTYAAPAREYAGVLAYEARVPVEFVERADAALGAARATQAQDGYGAARSEAECNKTTPPEQPSG